jgi:uncharacterized protein (TIGR00255 family)
MIRSMTGFGQGSADLDELRLTVELRTVNGRFGSLKLRTPGGLEPQEAEIRRRILKTVRRGRVEAQIRVEHRDRSESAPSLNRPLLEEVLATAARLREEFGIQGDLEPGHVLGIGGLFRAQPPEIEWGEVEVETVRRALEAALEALDRDRLREGRNLERDLLERIESMTGVTGEIAERARKMPVTVRERLLERLKAQSLGEALKIEPGRLAQEAVLLADRCDVTEEIVRLQGHLEQCHSLLVEPPKGEPLGKRLDFLAQEIQRETNTICSKSADLELTRLALSLKVESEKVREQVQNLE